MAKATTQGEMPLLTVPTINGDLVPQTPDPKTTKRNPFASFADRQTTGHSIAPGELNNPLGTPQGENRQPYRHLPDRIAVDLVVTSL